MRFSRKRAILHVAIAAALLIFATAALIVTAAVIVGSRFEAP